MIKTVYKSHFKVKKIFKKQQEKKIFLKNILIYLLFSNFFFKNCSVSFNFLKKKNNTISFLKAPSRHKKFFHQTTIEVFFLKIFLNFKLQLKIVNSVNELLLFNYLGGFFTSIGSNTLCRIKFTTIFFNLHKFELL